MKLSSVNILKDTVVFVNKLVCLFSSCIFNTDIRIRHNQFLVSKSLKCFLVLLNSGSSGFQHFYCSKILSLVNFKRKLRSINFIGCLLLVSQDLAVVIILSNLSLSSSFKIFFVVKSCLKSFHFLFLFQLI
jgi:hypothetical protein